MAIRVIIYIIHLDNKYLRMTKMHNYLLKTFSNYKFFDNNNNHSEMVERYSQLKNEVDINPFGSYLAGLFEGDGHIWIPSDNLTKKHNPRFCITFHKNDLPLAEIILKKIGSGFIRIKSKENAVVLTVSPIKGLIFIISHIKNYLRTPKINQVNQLITWLNLHHKINLILLNINENALNSDYWLAGFIDADGGFMINYTKKKGVNKNRDIVKLTLTIEQRILDPKTQESYESILKK